MVGLEKTNGGKAMNDKTAKERAKEAELTLVKSGDIILIGRGRVMRAKDFFALPLEKQIELKRSIPRLRADHWRKGQPKPTEVKP
jgi:hypothetical protein